MSSSSSNGPFTCPACSISLSNVSKLTAHLERHLGQRPYSCKLCTRKYVLKFEANRHIKEKHPNKDVESNRYDDPNFKENPEVKISCHYCKGIIRNREDLKSHAFKHKNLAEQRQKKPKNKEEKLKKDPPKPAEVDRELRNKRKQRFRDESQLRKLSRTMYPCFICLEKQPHIGELNLHLSEHLLEVKFHCQMCEFVCNSRREGVQHVVETHESGGLWVEREEERKEVKEMCRLCKEEVNSREEGEKHAKMHYVEVEVETSSHHG